MQIIIQAIMSFISIHSNYILGALGVFGFAAINSMPKDPPASLTELWDWVRESLQTAIPVNRSQRQQTTPDKQ